MHSPVFITRVKLEAQTQERLRKIIRNRGAADKFIRAAQTAIENFRAMRSLNQVTVSSPRQLASLRTAAKRYSDVVQQLTPQDVRDLMRAIPWLQEASLHDSQAIAAAVANGAADQLGLPRAPKGRRPHGHGIILIKTLAQAFEKAGQRVSSGDRSKFVRVIEVLCDNEPLGFKDVRQQVRTALKKGGNKYQKTAI